MLPKLRPGGIPDAIVHEELARELAMVNYPTRQGLYYHPEAWSRFTKPVAAFGTAISKAVNKLAPQPAGLYYNQAKWSEYMGRNGGMQPEFAEAATEPSGLYYNKKAWADYRQQTAVLVESDSATAKEGLLYNPEAQAKIMAKAAQSNAKAQATTEPAHKGLLYDPEAMAKFMKQTTLAEAKAIDAKPARAGIFYDSERWNGYLKQSMLLNATTMRTLGDGQTNRMPVFYHPEAWENYKKQAALSQAKTRVGAKAKTALLYHPEEWERTFDPAMVRIGRKSAIGTVVSRQSQMRKTDQKAATITNPKMTGKRFGTRPSAAQS